MPELPEVETVRRGLDPAMTGRIFARVTLNRPNLRFPFSERFVERITGKRLISLSRRAKFLIADLSSGDSLIMHLGMSGRFIIEAPDGIRPANSGRRWAAIWRMITWCSTWRTARASSTTMYGASASCC